jgi:hypothetical protein
MSRARSVLAVLALVVLSQVAAVGSASAGGPTSVLLVVPGAGQTASLYTGDADYEQLVGLLGAYDPVQGKESGSHEEGVGVTLTWLIHDVQVWRVDRVFLDADGGPWVSTQSSFEGDAIWDTPAVWHAPDRGKELSGLLDRLLDTDTARTELPVGPEATVAQPDTGAGTVTGTDAGSPEDAAQPVAATKTRWGVTGLVGLVGLALGAAMTLLALRRIPFRRQATADAMAPRQDDIATDPEFPMTDRLSWRTPAR